MNIAIIGLGLIGGSFCKAISNRTEHKCYGIDTNINSITMALEQGVIEKMITPDKLCLMDMVIVCLHPVQSIEFIMENKDKFKQGSVVIDSCGVKEEIVNRVTKPLLDNGVVFLGCHPMAGREFSGFAYSLETLYDGASFIMTPSDTTSFGTLTQIKEFALSLGFTNVVTAKPEEHDTVIAFTSQLAHVVSNAYIKSPSLEKELGFSAGSFLDLTRVAKLNEFMWTDLFMMNKKALLFEIDTIIDKLSEYKLALEEDDADTLRALLKKGSDLKENSMKKHDKN